VSGQRNGQRALEAGELWPPRRGRAARSMDEDRAGGVYEVTSCTPSMVATSLVPSPAVAPLLLAVDFDGTITMRDTLHVIVDEHGCEGVWEALEPDLRAGRITIEQAMSTQFAEVKAPPEEIHALVRDRAGVRDGIHELVRFAEEEGHRLVIMSAGFRSVIDQVLGDLGLGHLEVVSNEAIFSEDGCTLVFSDDRGEICELCDRRCKRHALRVRHEGERIVFVGDGISDRCVSGMADLVFARAFLAEWLDERGEPYVPFEDFHQVIEVVRAFERGEKVAA
jgi:2-hydroxy-3-keto-5-methylthiopentenyl-1-phosphate phosphatase